MPESAPATGALVTTDDHLGELVIANGLPKSAMALQNGFSTVDASSGSMCWSVVDFGDYEAYLHECGASLLVVGTTFP
jgi:hypothetical protein